MSTHTTPFTLPNYEKNRKSIEPLEVINRFETIDFNKIQPMRLLGALLTPYGSFFGKSTFQKGEYCSTDCGPFHVMAADDHGLCMAVTVDNDQGITLPLIVVRFHANGLNIQVFVYDCHECEETYPEDCGKALAARMYSSLETFLLNTCAFRR